MAENWRIFIRDAEEQQELTEPVAQLENSPTGLIVHLQNGETRQLAAQLAEVDFANHTVWLTAQTQPPIISYIFRRRSVRKYTAEPVSDEAIDLLLKAAMAAPSANDVRPWAFVVVREPERRRALAAIKQWAFMCAEAPVVFAVLGNPNLSDHWIEDCSAAAENLLLAAAGLGLGGVWVAIYPRAEYEKKVRTLLNIPSLWRVLCLLAIGHPAEHKPPRTRYEASKVYYETFGG
ncbi:nitroreductase family protein [uncultured Thermanaerothrix sp.]|uniref:nitroreductase family protein n=1 Tax=uncultured Thermanaerothrix sp. TaxID=1195149 RepID=UPI00260F942D|nr:nitroreductase family protein [uncultured Thermanaerothrix sp.]